MLNYRSSNAILRASGKISMRSDSQMHLFLVLCCLPLSSGSPYHFQDYFEEWDNNSAENLALCFTHWRALQMQPQFVMEFCNAIRQNVPRTEGGDSVGMSKRLSAVHPLLHLAPKLSERRMDRSLDSPRNRRIPDVYSQYIKHHLKDSLE
ncbi:neuromedin-S-like isoform X2 [Scyliorhinus torazame]|uniref:neuromedin-S-like isoform X2 n=1 Tax=Scyliorhinus torazame TaxID=75743 RepID=UPI003B5974D1